jgi:uncharacterized protein YndB with AHSA1/START domain
VRSRLTSRAPAGDAADRDVSDDQVRVMVSVAVPPAQAFDIFTNEIDQWWQRGPKYRHGDARRGFVHLEPKVGGRLFESFEVDGGETVLESGRVRVYEPPRRLVFSWRNATFAPDELTEVEVEFEPTRTGTRVTVMHRGWSAIRADHPARHGHDDRGFTRMLGLWWGSQMTSFRRTAG